MDRRKTGALMFVLAALFFLAVGIMNFGEKTYLFYGNTITGILFIIMAIGLYRKKDPAKE